MSQRASARRLRRSRAVRTAGPAATSWSGQASTGLAAGSRAVVRGRSRCETRACRAIRLTGSPTVDGMSPPRPRRPRPASLRSLLAVSLASAAAPVRRRRRGGRRHHQPVGIGAPPPQQRLSRHHRHPRSASAATLELRRHLGILQRRRKPCRATRRTPPSPSRSTSCRRRIAFDGVEIQNDAVQAAAAEKCGRRSPDSSAATVTTRALARLTVTYFLPNQTGFDAGAHWVRCDVVAAAGR